MANEYIRQAIDGGDQGVWARFENAQNTIALSLNTALLYLDATVLKLSKGNIGLDDDSQKGICVMDTVYSFSLVGLTASRWARIEISRTGTTVNLAITSIAAASNAAVLPASEIAAYDGDKGGYYLTTTKRILGFAWINAAGAVEGIVNMGDGAAYDGYSTSDDAYDLSYYFTHGKYTIPVTPYAVTYTPQTGVFTAPGTAQREIHTVTTAAASFAGNIPTAAKWAGKRIKIVKVDAGAGICTVTPAAGTFSGASAFPLRKYGDSIELESDGTSIYVVNSLSTLDSAALAVNAIQNLAHSLGVRPGVWKKSLVCITADLNFATNDEVDNWIDVAATSRTMAINCDATNFNVVTDSGAAAVATLNKTSKAFAYITMASWKIRIRYSI